MDKLKSNVWRFSVGAMTCALAGFVYHFLYHKKKKNLDFVEVLLNLEKKSESIHKTTTGNARTTMLSDFNTYAMERICIINSYSDEKEKKTDISLL